MQGQIEIWTTEMKTNKYTANQNQSPNNTLATI